MNKNLLKVVSVGIIFFALILMYPVYALLLFFPELQQDAAASAQFEINQE